MTQEKVRVYIYIYKQNAGSLCRVAHLRTRLRQVQATLCPVHVRKPIRIPNPGTSLSRAPLRREDLGTPLDEVLQHRGKQHRHVWHNVCPTASPTRTSPDEGHVGLKERVTKKIEVDYIAKLMDRLERKDGDIGSQIEH